MPQPPARGLLLTHLLVLDSRERRERDVYGDPLNIPDVWTMAIAIVWGILPGRILAHRCIVEPSMY